MIGKCRNSCANGSQSKHAHATVRRKTLRGYGLLQYTILRLYCALASFRLALISDFSLNAKRTRDAGSAAPPILCSTSRALRGCFARKLPCEDMQGGHQDSFHRWQENTAVSTSMRLPFASPASPHALTSARSNKRILRFQALPGC